MRVTIPAVIVFDLDDTLYLERDFVRSGLRAAGAWLEDTAGLPGLEERCLALFESGHRTRIFDMALEGLEVNNADVIVPQLVEIYRGHRPEIKLTEDADRYLGRQNDGERYALITDGIAETQAAKVRSLGLYARLGHVICTGAWGPGFGKPHPRAFEAVEAWSGKSGCDLVYVADNPTKDFITPRARGWRTVQILRPERVHHLDAPDAAHKAHAAITSLDELDDNVARLRGMEDCVSRS